MAQADLLVDLIKAATGGDQVTLRKVSEALIAEENRKGHKILSDRLRKAMRPEPVTSTKQSATRPSVTNGNVKDLMFETTPSRTLNSLVLERAIREQIKELVEEQHRADLLHAHGLRARNRILVSGPPGNGKTSLAEAVACELMYPLITIRYESLIGSYLGETADRLRRVLDYAKTQRCVLFFDEFETLGKERGDTHETGEIKRVVSSLLLQIDDLPDYVVVVAASNHPELLDRAVWRRFQLRLLLPLPTRTQLAQLIDGFSDQTGVKLGYTPDTLAGHLAGANFAEVEEFCLSVIRRAVLDHIVEDAKAITKLKLAQWKSRYAPAEN